MVHSYSIWHFCRRSLKCSGIGRNFRSTYTRGVSSDVRINPTDAPDVSTKILKVAIVGAPNSGKSTLINQIVQRRVFPVSKKVHTTRCRARAVFAEGDTQLVFLDTPGLVSASESQKYHLETEFMTGGEDAINEADVIGVVHDLSNGFTKGHLDPKVLRLLHIYKPKESILIMNKIDTVKSKRYLLDLADLLTGGYLNKPASHSSQLSENLIAEVVKRKSYWEHFKDVFMVSALLGQGTNDIRSYLMRTAHPGEWMFPEETFTDQKPVRLIEDTVRASLLDNLPQEIPYNLSVQLEFLDIDDRLDQVTAVVLVGCKAPRIHRLVVGSGGERIKAITSHAESILADAFQKEVVLRIVVSRPLKLPEYKEENNYLLRKTIDK
ncbi:hypothetical protein GE061_002358 [Apolygus lucorum]|uniref:GTPase Era, mitochondrial n=1 Tax=Apolygus lucorum TaxID=248454 RepID=A0A6A4JB45_APOLU|nr:hypothetical protein GE061_002358 [Apolygus lucorum]